MSDYTTLSHGLYIGGEWRPSSDGRVIEVVDPSTEAVIATVPDATLEDAIAAVEAAAPRQPAVPSGARVVAFPSFRPQFKPWTAGT